MNKVKSNDYSSQEYWDSKYAEKDTIFEWLEDYKELSPYINKHFSHDAHILIPGCGNSAISADMYRDGFIHIDNIDFSPVCIEQMKRRFSDLDQMTWKVMDIKNMGFPDNTFDIVFDKGTLDALTCGDDAETQLFTACQEYMRVLKPGCMAYIVSFGQAQDRLEYFNPSKDHPWIFEGFDLLDREIAPHSYYHVYKLRKPQ
ncbi:S-adenosyl-L-methionine-dependent methyltransferase [Histomonas meleagridis]|uniref:S-adenosyl-L-methionine-dependent methyltransferase n=1 Tax=Histomonas meleagridis TaxID=135588 RepID=UPI0035597425|nr:S-adenosyl-L-methionine-dependent methyltransferase [Histomonas meleagridis]KAH0801428.1 S-adenosyl-L-methionine-dependent methyltransferase [Histomonas meleagridis]